MFEKLEKLQILSLGLIVGISVIISTMIVSGTMSKNEISVTGSAYEIVTSDSGSLNFSINVKRYTKQDAYKVVQEQLKDVIKYLENKNIKNITVKSVQGYYSYKHDARTGYSTNDIESFTISQPITITSNDVELIKQISTDIQSLINQGIDIEVLPPSYDYSKLPELKVTLLEKASNDAKKRAESMLKPTRNKVGKIQAVKMGVYQITPPDSTNVSDMGINDTSTIEKKVTAVANITFKIK